MVAIDHVFPIGSNCIDRSSDYRMHGGEAGNAACYMGTLTVTLSGTVPYALYGGPAFLCSCWKDTSLDNKVLIVFVCGSCNDCSCSDSSYTQMPLMSFRNVHVTSPL